MQALSSLTQRATTPPLGWFEQRVHNDAVLVTMTGKQDTEICTSFLGV
jgi:hypothetical protein